MPRKHKSDWSWVEELNDASLITDDHRLKAAGLKDIVQCPYTFKTADDHSKNGENGTDGKKSCTKSTCGNNPGCVNHLGQAALPDTKGKERYVEGKLPSVDLRGNAPAGLRNLGATCYANAFLQLWFYNIPFRNAIYACATTEGSPLYHLSYIFASLQHTRRRFVDPTPLIEALRLDKGDQQDAGEFSKLFLDLIAGELSKQQDEKLKSFTRDLFEGHKEITITCACGYQSARQEAFLELAIPLKDGTSLLNRLEYSLAEENLEGDNQYNCPSCGRKRDAIRSTRLLDLPPVLHFTLLRFVYDLKAFERKKSKAKITFPKELELGGHNYRLQAVIIHSGSSAHQGHFICEALDEQVNGWWECNDETVTRKSRLVRSGSGENGHTPKKPRLENAEIASKDAYMLVYSRNAAVPVNSASEAVMQKVEEDHQRLALELGTRDRNGIILEEEYESLRSAKIQVARLLPGKDRLLPKAQLETWFRASTVKDLFGPWTIPTCGHGNIHPGNVEDSKLVSEAAFDLLSDYCTSATDVKPLDTPSRSRSSSTPTPTTYTTLPSLAICPTCVTEQYEERSVKAIVLSKEEKAAWKAELQPERQLRDNQVNPRFPVYGDTHYYLPTSFVEQWDDYLKAPFEARPKLPPDLGRCPHGKLDVDLEMDWSHVITDRGWGKLTAMYGQAVPITLTFVKHPRAGAMFPKGNVSVDLCKPCRRERLLDFDSTNITLRVERLTENQSRRTRKRDNDLPVDKSTTVLEIKRQVMEDLRIAPVYLKITYNDRELDNTETIESANVLAGDIIVCEELARQDEFEVDHEAVVEGFGGTALTGRRVCPDCTFENDAGSVCCAMCTRPFGYD